MTAKYRISAYDEEILVSPTDTVVKWPVTIEVLADTEQQAIEDAKKLVKRKNYRVTGAITVEAIRAQSHDAAMKILAETMKSTTAEEKGMMICPWCWKAGKLEPLFADYLTKEIFCRAEHGQHTLEEILKAWKEVKP